MSLHFFLVYSLAHFKKPVVQCSGGVSHSHVGCQNQWKSCCVSENIAFCMYAIDIDILFCNASSSSSPTSFLYIDILKMLGQSRVKDKYWIQMCARV